MCDYVKCYNQSYYSGIHAHVPKKIGYIIFLSIESWCIAHNWGNLKAGYYWKC